MPKKNLANQTRQPHTSAFKAQIALAAIVVDKTMAQLCAQFAIHVMQINEWKRKFLANALMAFDSGKELELSTNIKQLYATIRQLIGISTNHHLHPNEKRLCLSDGSN
jgi:transposase-like protein